MNTPKTMNSFIMNLSVVVVVVVVNCCICATRRYC